MRQCKKCDTELILGKNITQSYLNNSDFKCKECRKAYRREWVKDNDDNKEYQAKWILENKEHKNELDRQYHHANKDGGYVVYLTKDDYAGATQHTKNRLSVHESKRGYEGKYLCVLHKTDCEYEATELEDLLHDMGYKGRHIQNKPYWAMI